MGLQFTLAHLLSTQLGHLKNNSHQTMLLAKAEAYLFLDAPFGLSDTTQFAVVPCDALLQSRLGLRELSHILRHPRQ